MPFKSRAQRAKMAMMVQRGQLSKAVFSEFAAATPKGKKLPEHVKPRKGR